MFTAQFIQKVFKCDQSFGINERPSYSDDLIQTKTLDKRNKKFIRNQSFFTAPLASFNVFAAIFNVSSHSTATNCPDLSFNIGKAKRWFFKPSYENLDLSASHSSFTSC